MKQTSSRMGRSRTNWVQIKSLLFRKYCTNDAAISVHSEWLHSIVSWLFFSAFDTKASRFGLGCSGRGDTEHWKQVFFTFFKSISSCWRVGDYKLLKNLFFSCRRHNWRLISFYCRTIFPLFFSNWRIEWNEFCPNKRNKKKFEISREWTELCLLRCEF